MIEIEYEPVATSSDGAFNLEDVNLDGGDHLLVVQATDESGEVTEYSDEIVYSQEHSVYSIQKTTLDAIADSVRSKTGKTDPIPTESLPEEILSITTGITPTGTKYITKNDEYDVTAYEKVDVNVPVPEVTAEEVTVTPTESEQIITPPTADYISKVIVEPIPEEYIIPTGSTVLRQNTFYNVKQYATVEVNVPTGITPTGTKYITENDEYDVTAYEKVDVNVPIPDEYLEAANGLSEIDTLVTGRPSTVPMQGSWRLNPTVDITTAIDCNVSFITTYQDNGVEYLMTGSQIAIGVEGKYITFRGALTPEFPGAIDNWIVVYASGVWGLGSDRTITFTGEISPELSEWLNVNAEQLSPTDSVKYNVQELIDMSNSTTGNNETDLTGAVSELIRSLRNDPGQGSVPDFDGTISSEPLSQIKITFAQAPDTGVDLDIPMYFWTLGGGVYCGGIVVNSVTGTILYKEWDAGSDTMTSTITAFSNGAWTDEGYKTIYYAGPGIGVSLPAAYAVLGWLVVNSSLFTSHVTITCNGVATTHDRYETITIPCNGTKMLSDIVIQT